MKPLKLSVVLLLVMCQVNAQKIIEKHFDYSGKQSLSLNIQISDSIKVQTWNKNEVYITGSVNINDNKDNEAYEVRFDDSGKTLAMKASFKEDYFKGKKNCCNESEINWVVFMPESAVLSVESINADITITGKTGSVIAKSISGFIDLTIPDSRSASLDFSTISGTVYSNHLLTSTDTHSGIPSKIRYKLNNGGESIKLETISGDIFFRK